MADKQRSFRLLERYFKDTPKDQILRDMRKYCPELFPDSGDERERWRLRLWLRVFQGGDKRGEHT